MERWQKSSKLMNFQYELSRKTVDNTKSNALIIGDLKVKKWLNLKKERKKAFSKYINSDQGYLFQFIEFLAYKCKLIGKLLIKIDESFNSKECYVCETRQEMPLWE